MAMYLRPRRGKKATAISQNIILKRGEVFFESPETGTGTGAGKIKIGDGTTPYKDLPYFLETESFQNGVDTIYNGCTTYGSTPKENTPSAIVDAIKSIYDNRYKDGVTNTKIGTAFPENVLEGQTFTGLKGVGIFGTMANRGAQEIHFHPCSEYQECDIPEGYHNGRGRIYCKPTEVHFSTNSRVNLESGKTNNIITLNTNIFTTISSNRLVFLSVILPNDRNSTISDISFTNAEIIKVISNMFEEPSNDGDRGLLMYIANVNFNDITEKSTSTLKVNYTSADGSNQWALYNLVIV